MSKTEKRVIGEAEKAETIAIPMEKVEEMLKNAEIVFLKLCVVGSCCHGMECTEAEGLEIIVCEIGHTLDMMIIDTLETALKLNQEVPA